MNDMVTTLSLGQLAKALAAAQAEMKPAAKDANNPHFKSKYADLEAVNEAARVLAKHGIAVMCVPDGWNDARVVIRAMLVHSSGEYIEGRLEVPVSQPNNPQALGSAMTYGRRYAVSALANIATSDDDGNEASTGAQSAPKQAAPKQAAPNPAPKQDEVVSNPNSPKPPVNVRCKQKTDDIIAAMNAATSFGDACRVLAVEGVELIEGSEWTLTKVGAVGFIKANAPTDYARIVRAYEDIQAKDITA